MNSSRGEQPHEVYRFTLGHGSIHRCAIGLIIGELPLYYGFIDSRDRLINDSTRAQTHVAYLAIPHLPLGQPHVQPGPGYQAFWGVIPQEVPVRGVGVGNGIVFTFWPITKAIQND